MLPLPSQQIRADLGLPFAAGKASAKKERGYSKSIPGDSGLEQNDISKSVSMEETSVFQ